MPDLPRYYWVTVQNEASGEFTTTTESAFSASDVIAQVELRIKRSGELIRVTKVEPRWA